MKSFSIRNVFGMTAVAAMTVFVPATAEAQKQFTMADLEADANADSLKLERMQELVVTSVRATKKTPVAFTNMSQEQLKAVNYGKDVIEDRKSVV